MQEGVSVNGKGAAYACNCACERSCDCEPVLPQCVNDRRLGLPVMPSLDVPGYTPLCVLTCFASWETHSACEYVWACVRRTIVCNSLCVCDCKCVIVCERVPGKVPRPGCGPTSGSSAAGGLRHPAGSGGQPALPGEAPPPPPE